MLEKVKVLIVGIDTYGDNDNYGPLRIDGYPFPTVAFIPKLKETKDKESNNYGQRLYSITSFRRLVSFLANEALKENDFDEYVDVNSLTNKLKEKGIYLTNIKEINKEQNIINYFKEKHSEDISVILFGKETKKLWYESIGKKENFKVLEFPHPSPRVQHSVWLDFDYQMQERNKIKLKKVEKYRPFCEN